MNEFLENFLENFVIARPPDAENPMCYRVKAKVLYEGYKKHCQRYGWITTPEDFIESVEKKFPTAKLSDWRWVENNWHKEFDGIMLAKYL